MNRRRFLIGSAALAACGRGAPRLNVFNWSNYVAPETIPEFEQSFQAQVRYGIYESNEEMLAKVFGGNSGWDVVFPSNYLILPMRENGLLAELDHALMPNLKHLDERFRAPEWDPELRWSVPYMWGASGILYNRAVQPPPAAWADLWSQRLNGRITMLDDPAEVLGAALKKLGYSVNSSDPAELHKARDTAIAQKPYLRAYLNAEVRDQAVAGDVLAAQLWATTAAQAIEQAPQLAFCYPAEGFAVYADNAVILRESGRPELAHKFLNYLLEPKVAAAIAAHTRTATVNRAAFELLPADLARNETLYPPPSTLGRGEWFRTLPAATQRLRDRLWTEIKAA